MKKILYPTLAAICLLFTACQKEAVVGPQGPAGTNGVDGVDGNMKVVTYESTLDTPDWVFAGTQGATSARYVATLYFSAINSSIVNNGTVLLYYKSASGSWFSLPQTFYETSYSYTLTYGYSTGQVSILRYDSDLRPLNEGHLEVKTVIIPGAAKANINYSDYEAVKTAYHLAD
jgi:hypothetical protein